MRIDTSGVIVTCKGCGQANRLAFELLNRTTRCGQCKAPLAAPDAPIDVSNALVFDAASTRSALPLLVDFWAPWCAPCRMLAPEIERVARASAGRYLVVKVNSDAVPDVAARFTIRSIPTLVLVSGGRELGRMTGVRSASDIEAFAARTMAAATPRAS
jgi:thioredoxin 2